MTLALDCGPGFDFPFAVVDFAVLVCGWVSFWVYGIVSAHPMSEWVTCRFLCPGLWCLFRSMLLNFQCWHYLYECAFRFRFPLCGCRSWSWCMRLGIVLGQMYDIVSAHTISKWVHTTFPAIIAAFDDFFPPVFPLGSFFCNSGAGATVRLLALVCSSVSSPLLLSSSELSLLMWVCTNSSQGCTLKIMAYIPSAFLISLWATEPLGCLLCESV